MIRYGELIKALNEYTRIEIYDQIPDDYYRAVITMSIRQNKKNRQWDIQHVAAVLLYLALNKGQLNSGQLNNNGIEALEWAKKLLDENDLNINQYINSVSNSS